MSVIQARRAREGKPIATLVNYAIHPEVLGNGVGDPQPRPGRPALRAHRGAAPAASALFMNGAQGGMVTADNRDLDQPARPAARLLGRRAHLGRVPADRPPDGGRGAADRQGRARSRTTRRSVCDAFACGSRSSRTRCGPSSCGSPLKYPHDDGPHDHRADQPRQPRRRPDPDHPRRGPAEHRLLPQAQDARAAQPPLRPDQRRLRLHPHEGRLPQLPALRLRLAHVARRDDRRDPDREVARVRQQSPKR